MNPRLPISFLVLVLLAATASVSAAPPSPRHPDALAPAALQDEPPADEAEPAEGETAAGEVEETEDEWDVSAPHGPASTVEIDVTEGTWMSLDVSPDGREIVFDLLGDLYTVPIEGGEATALTEGLAWDMQPVYSPDGSRIAFTSDRGGGDNLWVMGRDGSDPEAVTEEGFRLLNSPAWAPDGEFLAGRKHFTARRSLGAGEIWLYHRSGGAGLQMTEKPNDQKDVGEPAFSPDGRYVYYSQDTTPGPIFEYNKDPNPGIYSIKRLDRQTGETEVVLGGPGGAARPTPSPDGERMAFVKRIRAQSVLYVADLDSGEEWPVYDPLDRDMQQTWAIHGVYPHMAWTPDSREIVFWAGGKIRRVDVETREAREIPFQVTATKTVVEPLRFPVEVAPETFTVQMIRWAQVSPDGGRLAFQALGKIWVKDLPDGAPRRLTSQDDHFEYYPSWSRDGRRIVYTTWDDRELGAVRVAPASGGGPSRAVTSEPGHYVEPVFTPDGGEIVYRKIDGGYLTSPLWSAETGVYRVPSGGGEATLVLDHGRDPRFGSASDRVFLTRRDGDKSVLFSVGLAGAADEKAERDHLTSPNATLFRVSPDGRWVAWQERFEAHVAPFVATGKAVEIGPETKSVPVATASRDAGNFLHWGPDSGSLHWTLGPELYSRDLTESFAFLEGAPEELPEPPSEGVAVGLTAETAKPAGAVALVGGRVITMRGDEVIEDGVVVVEGDRVVAVGARAEVEIPAGADEVDVSGKTVIPGLVDVHWHGGHGEAEMEPEQNWNYFATLAYGVTTIHDPSADTSTVFSSSEMARTGRITAPRVYSTGTILYGAETPFRAVIESLDDARSHLRRMKAQGAISVKSYNQPRRDQRQQVVQAARELEMMVVPEGGSLYQHNMTMVVDGHTGVEHSIPVAAVYDDVLQLWSATEVGYTPTLVVGYGGLWGENYWYATTDVWSDERLLTFVPREIVDARARRRVLAPEEEWGHFANARVAAELEDAGVKVLVGAHGQREGLGAHWEMWMMEQGGMTPHEALRAGTLDGAWYLGMDGDLGSIEPGKLADLAVLASNPLEDLRSSTDVDLVMVGGVLYDARTLDQMAPRQVEREPFFFERDEAGRLVVRPEPSR